MFKPSQSLLKLKIHHPLPLNHRESKQLLKLLTVSFRQQLDTEHGHFRTDTPKPKHHENHRQRRHSATEPWRPPTDRHMHSLLTNPLFSLPPNGLKFRSVRDPMDIFDHAVANGMMDLNYAKAVLNAKKLDIVQSAVLSVQDGMRNSGAGLKVLKWLISSGTTSNLGFLKDEQFAKILMEYMVAEGLQEAIWTWIKKSFEDLPKLSSLAGLEWRNTRRDIVRPLMLLVKAETVGHIALDTAYICLSRAAGYLKRIPVAEMRHILGPPGWFLAHMTVMSSSQHPPPSESSFESFLSLVPTISRDIDYYFAHLKLIHPTKPSADLAIEFLEKMGSPEKRQGMTFAEMSEERNHVQLGLDTAKFLLETDRCAEAEWVMDLLRTNYPIQLGLKQRKQLEQARAEAASLEILDGLSLA